MEIPTIKPGTGTYFDDTNNTIDTSSKGKTFIEMPRVPLDIDAYFLVKVKILHHADIEPSFIPKGKIIGQNEIKIVDNIGEEKKLSFGALTFGGNWLVQLVRFLSYFVIGIVIFLGIIYLIIKIDDSKDQKKDKNRKLRQQSEIEHRKEQLKSLDNLCQTVFDEYSQEGYHVIQELYDLYNNSTEESITEKYRKIVHYFACSDTTTYEGEKVRKEFEKFNDYFKKQFIYLSNDFTVTFNMDAKQSVERIIEALNKPRNIEKEKTVDEILESI